eukprot:TRINITY_DN12129_c0_g1_i3.p1 TRINITY_DN12129_c0_g1~~TRINITY_DN12129_c0_g1_i3.p1  ORF type:complete len:262 (-),score=41.69 TRINITY_DN12129_c0_g1_i3:171-893(-)
MLRFFKSNRFKALLMTGSIPVVCGVAYSLAMPDTFKENMAHYLSLTSRLFVGKSTFPPFNFLYSEHIQPKTLMEARSELPEETKDYPCSIVLNGIAEKNFFDPKRATCVGILCESKDGVQDELLKAGLKTKTFPQSQVLHTSYKGSGESLISRVKIRGLLREFKRMNKEEKAELEATVPMIWILRRPNDNLAFIPYPEALGNYRLPQMSVKASLYIIDSMLGETGSKEQSVASLEKEAAR